MSHDADRLKQGAVDLPEAEADFDSALEFASIGVGIATVEGRWKRVNRAIRTLTGYDDSELVGNGLLTLFASAPRQIVADSLNRLVTGKTPVMQLEQPVRCNGGGIIWCDIRATLIKTKGKAVSCIIQIEDITARREAREQIHKQAALLDQTDDAILVLDIDRKITYWNAGAASLWGWSKEEAAHKSAYDLLGSNQDILPLDALLDKTLNKGAAESELSISMGEDGLRTISVRCNRLPGGSEGILAICNDVTEKRKIESDFLRSQRLEGIGHLASGIAHDLNNVLAPIQYSFPIFRNPKTDAATVQYVIDTLEPSVKRGTSIVRQLLAFGRGEDSKNIVFQCRHLIWEMVKMTRQSFPENIEIARSVPGDLWTIRGDETQIHQILMDLCTNARDAMPEGGKITMAAQNLEVDERFVAMEPRAFVGNWICISVTDNGEGIDPEVRDRIFDSFFTTKEVGKGAGLGLSTVAGIVKSHKGFIEVESELGAGSTFKVYLPAEHLDEVVGAVDSAEIPRGSGQVVMLVEDDEAICVTSAELLKQWGYDCLIARSGIEGAAIFTGAAQQIDLVIASLKLRGLDGATLIRIVKRANPDIPAIVTTGLPDERLLKHLEDEEGIRVLIKPHTSENLLQAIGEMLADVPKG